jgi:hypothetical protein
VSPDLLLFYGVDRDEGRLFKVPSCPIRFINYGDPADSGDLVDTNITPFSLFIEPHYIHLCQRRLY